MLLSYLGALKTWFYSALFWLTPPRPISLRLPMLIAAAAALCLFFVLLDRTQGDALPGSARSYWPQTAAIYC